MSSTTSPVVPGRVRVVASSTGFTRRSNSPGSSVLSPTRARPASRSSQSPPLGRGRGGLRRRPEPGRRHLEHDGQGPGRELVRRRRSGRTDLDVDLVRDQVDERAKRARRPRPATVRVGQRAAGPAGRWPCGSSGRRSTPRGPGPCPPPGRDRPAGRPASGQSARCTGRGPGAVPAPRRAPPDLLGDQRQQRRGHPAQHVEHRRRACRTRPGCRLAVRAGPPEPVPAAADVPVGRGRRGTPRWPSHAPGQVVGVHGRRDRVDQRAAPWPARSGPGCRPRRCGRAWPRRSSALAYRVKKYQAFHSGQQRLPDRVGDPLLVDDQVAAAQHRRRHEEPAHGVGPVGLEHLLRIGVVAQPLGHLLAVVAEHDAVRHARS